MRIVAGTAGGRRLRGPTGADVRPTTDKVREAVFNSLHSMNAVEGAKVVDLFAGTGACGIEALSRGAESVTFVENDRRALATIRENLDTTGLSGEVIASDVLAFLGRPHQFDLAFADPPYAFDDWQDLLARLQATHAVCESDRPVSAPDPWELVRGKRYGDTEVTIFRRAG